MTSVARVCSVEGCGRPHSAKGFCSWHYQRSRQGVDLYRAYGSLKSTPETCTYRECGRPHVATGLCAMHYKRSRKGQDMEQPHRKDRPRKLPPEKPRAEKAPRLCGVEGCSGLHSGRGLCARHYRLSRSGKPLDSPAPDAHRYRGRNCFISDCPNSAGGSTGICKSHSNWAGKYSLSVAQAVQILNSGYPCDICGLTVGRMSINVDHDHSCCPGQGTCGRCIRGLLCRGCNRAIGSFSEDRENIRKALAYLGG